MSQHNNSHSCCFTDKSLLGVEVRRSEEAGRGLWTTKEFIEGDVVFGNEPYAYVLSVEYIDQRCSYCFTKNNENGLNKCGKCKFVHYCDVNCQRADWVQHKAECAALTSTKSGSSLLKTCRKELSNVLSDVRLLLRLSPLLDSSITDSAGCIWKKGNSVQCSSSHVLDMCEPTSSLDSCTQLEQRRALQLAVFYLSKKKEKSKGNILSEQQLQSLLQKFRGNNFGITDQLLQCIGAGVYPAVALLNHSCQPSCVLRYDIIKGRSVSVQVIAIGTSRNSTITTCSGQDVGVLGAGEELTHSYVDLAEPTYVRQEKINSTYGFQCKCGRCFTTLNKELNNSISICEEFAETGSIEKDIKIAMECTKTKGTTTCNVDGVKRVSISVEKVILTTRIPESDVNCIRSKVAHMQHQAGMLSIQNSDQQIAAQQEVVTLEKALALLNDVVGPFHYDMYKVHGQLLTASLISGDLNKALSYCFKVVGYLFITFSDVPRHPLLGLQLYTLGDILMSQEGRTTEAHFVYSWSYNILKITFGRNHDLVQRLQELLADFETIHS